MAGAARGSEDYAAAKKEERLSPSQGHGHLQWYDIGPDSTISEDMQVKPCRDEASACESGRTQVFGFFGHLEKTPME
jgi:hypothetical protein